MSPDFATVESVAAKLCQLSGGDWNRKRTKKNLWRKRAMALIELARGNMVGAKRAMRGGK